MHCLGWCHIVTPCCIWAQKCVWLIELYDGKKSQRTKSVMLKSHKFWAIPKRDKPWCDQNVGMGGWQNRWPTETEAAKLRERDCIENCLSCCWKISILGDGFHTLFLLASWERSHIPYRSVATFESMIEPFSPDLGYGLLVPWRVA